MSVSLRIAIADDEPLMLRFLQDSLDRLGHQVVAAAANGQELVEQCRTQQPDLVITDIKMPAVDGFDAAALINTGEPIPVVIVSAHHDAQYIDRAQQNHILGYLIKPIKEEELAPAIAVAMQRFAEFEALREQTDNLRQALEDRKVIERAKGIIMKQAVLDEPAAFKRLQKLARNSGQKLVEVARMVVTTAAALQPDDDDEDP